MSCHMVDDKVINGLVEWMLDAHVSGDQRSFAVGHMSGVLGGDSPDTRRALGERLHALNLKSVRTRYPDNHKKMVGEPYECAWAKAPSTLVRFAKTLDYYLYQCDEAGENDSLLRNLEEVRRRLHFLIVSELEDYKSAEWGYND